MRLEGSPLWWITNPSQETDEALESVSPKESGMEFNNLPDDIKEKVALCKSSEELLALGVPSMHTFLMGESPKRALTAGSA